MLNDFFRINMPYGMMKNEKNEWFCFNREYMPLGWNNASEEYKLDLQDPKSYSNQPIWTKYKGLTEDFLRSLAANNSDIRYSKDGTIKMVWLYTDATNPMNDTSMSTIYFDKLKRLSKLKISEKIGAFRMTHPY